MAEERKTGIISDLDKDNTGVNAVKGSTNRIQTIMDIMSGKKTDAVDRESKDNEGSTGITFRSKDSVALLSESLNILKSIHTTLDASLRLKMEMAKSKDITNREALIEQETPQADSEEIPPEEGEIDKEGGFSRFIKSLISFRGSAAALSGFMTAAGGIIVSAGALFIEALPVIAAIAGAVVAGVFLYKFIEAHTEDITRVLVSMADNIDIFIQNVVNYVKELIDRVKEANKNPIENITGFYMRSVEGMSVTSVGGVPASPATVSNKKVSDAPRGDIVAFGKYIQRKYGVRLSGHTAFGGQEPGVHDRRGKHYDDHAIDVNFGYGVVEANDPKYGAMFDEINREAIEAGYKTLWRTKRHYNHLHIQQGGTTMMGSGDQQGPKGDVLQAPPEKGPFTDSVAPVVGAVNNAAVISLMPQIAIARSAAALEKNNKSQPQSTTPAIPPSPPTSGGIKKPISLRSDTSQLLDQYLTYFDVADTSTNNLYRTVSV